MFSSCYHSAGVSMTNISGVIRQLKKEHERLEDQLHRITAALAAFTGVYRSSSKKGTMSAAGRRKISLAQKARWAKVKDASYMPTPKRTISAAGRKRIAAAQRARWAKVRAAKKTA
jgi:hypothetical protein